MTQSEMRSWLYAVAWVGGGIASGALAAWIVMLVRWDWPASRAEQQLGILGNALLGMIGLMALVILGLSLRNAIKNIKGTLPGGASFEANGQDVIQSGDSVTVVKEGEP